MPPKKAMVKPSMEKLYEECYATYTAKYGPRTAVLLNVGSFYSMYDKIHTETGKALRNIQEVAEACAGVPRIESRDTEWNHVMWGFPEHASSKFEQYLLHAGYTVVFIQQDRDPMGKVAGRSMERVVSPGTYIDSSLVAEERRVIGVLVEAFMNRGRPAWHIASTAFTVSTGDCVSLEHVVPLIDGKPNLDALESFWSAYPPSEVVLWTRDVTLKDVRWFGAFRGPVHQYPAEPRSAAATRGALAYLHRVYARDTALQVGTYLDVENYPSATESLTFLLRWIEDHNPSYLANLRNHRMWEPAEELILGNVALQQLGMLPLHKPNECLLHWLQKTQTPMGRRALRERCVRPITAVAELNARQDRIAQFRTTDVRQHLYNMTDLAKVYRKFHMGKGDREVLLGMLGTATKALGLAEACASITPMPPDAKKTVEELLDTWDAERIRACTTEHALGLGPHHPWRRGIHADLDAMEDAWCAVLKEVETLRTIWADLLDDGEDAIKVEWKDEFLWTTTKRRAVALATVLQTRRKYKLDYVAKTSAATLHSPQLTELSAKAKQIWENWTAATEERWRTTWLAWEGSQDLVDWIAQVDVDAALARCAEEYGYVRPTYVEFAEAGFAVKDLRHPILERVTDMPYIAHSVALGDGMESVGNVGSVGAATARHGILLYGVNAAGKSSLSKAIGLAILMAQIGMPVPATELTLSPYNGLYTRILGNDNLWAGMSSFVVEMTELRSILNAGPRSLVLGDELCAGTETTSAIAIVGAGIRRLVEKEAHFIFATHLHELLDIPELAAIPTVRPYHLSVRAPPAGHHALIYDRVLREGRGPAIYGLEVCRGLDMDAQFLEYAATMRRAWEGGTDLAKTSRYNAAVPVQVCDVCGARDGLETHHIVPQAAADRAGFVGAGRHKNEQGNLVVLCTSCHDQHHAGTIRVHGWQATSVGKKLDLSRFKRIAA